MTERLETLAGAAASTFGDEIIETIFDRGELTLRVTAKTLLPLLTWLRDDAPEPLSMLMDISAVDGRDLNWQPRFRVSYHLLKPTSDLRVRVQSDTDEDEQGPSVPSAVDLWEIADWNEREVWDLMGVRFTGHPDLRRILQHENTDQGHPLQKQVPVRGTEKDCR
ncbi:MAG: NADH-quinone oxidoreductase subunit C [bacterium]|nr:NADH-quinone oxidoreductase subunit C [bacterium]